MHWINTHSGGGHRGQAAGGVRVEPAARAGRLHHRAGAGQGTVPPHGMMPEGGPAKGLRPQEEGREDHGRGQRQQHVYETRSPSGEQACSVTRRSRVTRRRSRALQPLAAARLRERAASASTTRSWSPRSSCAKNGSASVRRLASSATGQRPSREAVALAHVALEVDARQVAAEPIALALAAPRSRGRGRSPRRARRRRRTRSARGRRRRRSGGSTPSTPASSSA